MAAPLTQETLDVIYHYDTHWALRAVRKHFGDSMDLLCLRETDHIVRCDELDEREL